MTRSLLAHLALLAVVLFITYTHLVLKWQADSVLAAMPERRGFADYLAAMLTNPWVLSVVVSAVLALVGWLMVLTALPVSYAYPFLSLSFVLVPLGAVWLLGERVSVAFVAGAVLVAAGLVLILRAA